MRGEGTRKGLLQLLARVLMGQVSGIMRFALDGVTLVAVVVVVVMWSKSLRVVISLAVVSGSLVVNLSNGTVRPSLRSGLLSPEMRSGLGTTITELTVEQRDELINPISGTQMLRKEISWVHVAVNFPEFNGAGADTFLHP